MYIRDYMTTKVITVTSDTLLADAQQIMKEHNIKRLPVVDDGKLVGIVTRTKLRDVSPSPATSLSIWELNYILAKMKVKEVMERNVVTIPPDMTVEEASLLAQEKGIGATPVVEKGKLVGIITQTDIFKIFLDIIGVKGGGVRIHLLESYKGKPFGEVTEICNKHGAEIMSMFRLTHPTTGRKDLVLRIDVADAGPVIKEFQDRGYTVMVG